MAAEATTPPPIPAAEQPTTVMEQPTVRMEEPTADAATLDAQMSAELEAWLKAMDVEFGDEPAGEGAAHVPPSTDPTDPAPASDAPDAHDAPLDREVDAPKERNPALLSAQARLAGRLASRFIMGQVGRRYRRRKVKYLLFGGGAVAFMAIGAPVATSVIGGGIAAKMAITRFARYRRGVDARAVRRNDAALHPELSWEQNQTVHALRFNQMIQSTHERVLARLPGEQRRDFQVKLAKADVVRAKIAAMESADRVRREEGLPDGTVDVMAPRRATKRLRYEQQLGALEQTLAPVMQQAEQTAVGEFGTWATKVALMRRSAGLPDLTGPPPTEAAPGDEPESTPQELPVAAPKRKPRASSAKKADAAAEASAS